jgi:hypothetical protein
MTSTTPPFTIFPRYSTAEDQTHAHAILTIHVAHRAFQTGATIGLLTGGVRAALASRTTTPTKLVAPSLGARVSAREIILRSAGRSALGTTVLLTAVLPGYMAYQTREAESAADRDYAWRDRSWRLLHNEGQVGVDQGSVLGMVVGAGAVLVGGGLRGAIGRSAVYAAAGRVGVGSLVGVVGWEVWRYGIREN